jgi:hypothetical protein
MLFILAGKSFSEMFTTYSHALAPSSPAGLRLETRFKIDKKKMNFIFLRREKIFLTKKGNAHVRRRTKK